MTKEIKWIDDKMWEQIFLAPAVIDDMRYPIMGQLKNKQSIEYVETYSNLISREFISKYVDLKHKNPQLI